MPSDVRRGYASPLEMTFTQGYALGLGLAQWSVEDRAKGVAHNSRGLDGEAQPRLTSGGIAEATVANNSRQNQFSL